MEDPTPNPDGAASLFPSLEGDAATDFLWQSFLASLPHESLFNPESGHHVGPTIPVAGSGRNLDRSLAPPTCGAQAARAGPRIGAGINMTSYPMASAASRHPTPHPAHDQTAAPVPPSVLSGIARAYETAAPFRAVGLPDSAPPAAQARLPWTPSHPPWPFGTATNWLPIIASPGSNAADAFLEQLETPVNPGLLHTTGISYPSLDATPAYPEALAQWASPINSDSRSALGDRSFVQMPTPRLDTPAHSFDTSVRDGGSETPTSQCSTPSWPGGSYPLTPSSSTGGYVVGNDHGQQEPDVSTIVRTQGPSVSKSASVKARRPRDQPTSRCTELAIVQYKPQISTDKSTKKRPALEEISPSGIAAQTLREVVVHDERGEVKGTMITFGNRVKTRAVFSEEKRQRTALARREGVCPRCKRSKRQCDLAQKQSLYVSCSLCTGTKIYKNAPRHPCFRATLEDVLFFRSGPAPNEPFFTKREMVYKLGDLSEPDASVRTLRLTQNIGSHRLTVYASEFVPLPGDVVSYKWSDRAGRLHELKMPHFCLTNIDKIRTHFRQYIAAAKWSYLRCLETEDELAWMTVSTAIQYAERNPDSLVADVLHLWEICRMIEIPWQMCGPDTLGVSRVRDSTSPHYGKIPIPPTMDTLLDQIVIQSFLRPLGARVVRKFEQLINPARPDAWWEVYLSSFILLNHIERLARHSVFHARTHTMASKYSNIPFLEAVFHTAKSILARFHFVCNGSVPLRLDWTSPRVAAMAKLEPDQVEFMQRTQAMVAARENDVRTLRKTHKYERTLYWAGQLFTEGFDTSPVHVVEEVEDDEG